MKPYSNGNMEKFVWRNRKLFCSIFNFNFDSFSRSVSAGEILRDIKSIPRQSTTSWAISRARLVGIGRKYKEKSPPRTIEWFVIHLGSELIKQLRMKEKHWTRWVFCEQIAFSLADPSSDERFCWDLTLISSVCGSIYLLCLRANKKFVYDKNYKLTF